MHLTRNILSVPMASFLTPLQSHNAGIQDAVPITTILLPDINYIHELQEYGGKLDESPASTPDTILYQNDLQGAVKSATLESRNVQCGLKNNNDAR